MAGCTICTNPSARALVNGALLAGTTPRDVFRFHGEALGVSQSALYRHARAHVRIGLVKPWRAADSTTGDVVSDMATMRRGLVQQFHDAAERGDSAASARAAHEAASISATLLKSDFESDKAVAYQVYVEALTDTLITAMRDRHELATELLAVAESLGHSSVVEDMQESMDFLETENKEYAA
jgi:hypothetical protein